MAVLNFNRILLMLEDPGSIPQETLHSQDRLNLRDICFCPIGQTLCIQCISLDHLWKLIAEGVFMPPHWGALQSSVGLPSSWSSRCLHGTHCPQGRVLPQQEACLLPLCQQLWVPCPFPWICHTASSTQRAM